DLERWPEQMDHLRSATELDGRRSYWIAQGPLGQLLWWDAEITEERENELLAWRTTGGDVRHRGVVRFAPAPGGRGTEVRVSLQLEPPGGPLEAVFARLLGQDPEHEVQEGLRRIKRLLEVGEIATTQGQPAVERRELGRAA